ncbi:MAG TPA: c-type cytochrome biogenesis protein CcmI [Gemmatimonadaceae bacterium]
MIALIVGTVLAVAALSFVLWPLFREPRPAPPLAAPPAASRAEQAAARRAVEALREVEFDRETGKLSDADYEALRATYTREALAAMRAEEAGAATGAGTADVDEVEAVVLAYRSRLPACAECGPRPEPDAIYCSSCGRYLAGRCGRCGAEVTETGARFCAACGGTLAA